MTVKTDTVNSNKYYIGIDAGSVSINCVVINNEKKVVYESPYFRHMGKIEEAVQELIRDLCERFGNNSVEAVAFTGSHGKNISEKVGGFYEFETISQVTGSLFIKPDVRSIISMGGQDTALFQINHHHGTWELEHFATNGPCASGTGSFIDQQAQRLAASIYDKDMDRSQKHIDKILADFIDLGLRSENPSNVACRCTVFTKSDMIHLQNKGERLEDIISGLHVGNARNYISTIVSNRVLEAPIIFIGGLSLNKLQVRAFNSYFPQVIVPEYSTSAGALGVALQALEKNMENSLNPGFIKAENRDSSELPTALRLELKQTSFTEDNRVEKSLSGKDVPVYLGIDIGSTTTKYAIINEQKEIIHKEYVHTQGKPIEVTQRLLKKILDDVGNKIRIMGTALTRPGPPPMFPAAPMSRSNTGMSAKY